VGSAEDLPEAFPAGRLETFPLLKHLSEMGEIEALIAIPVELQDLLAKRFRNVVGGDSTPVPVNQALGSLALQSLQQGPDPAVAYPQGSSGRDLVSSPRQDFLKNLQLLVLFPAQHNLRLSVVHGLSSRAQTIPELIA
jgi:hypothetical protein